MYSSEYLKLRYLPGPGVLHINWLAEPPFEQAQREYYAHLPVAFAHHTARWLVDLRRRPQLGVQISAWVVQQWLPRVALALAPQRLRLALLVWDDRADLLHENPELLAIQELMFAPDCPYDSLSFFDEAEALAWLCG